MLPQRKDPARPQSSRGGEGHSSRGAAVALSRCESRLSLLWVSSPIGAAAPRHTREGVNAARSFTPDVVWI